MKPQWISYHNRFENLVTLFSKFYEGVTDKRTQKAVNTVVKELNALIAAHNEFGKLVEPIPPLEIKMPFESKAFAEEWKFYKEYLEESHQMFLPSRAESRMLRYLSTISGKKEARAIQILDFYIRNQYKTMFIPTDKQLTGEEVDTTKESSSTGLNLNMKKVDL